MLLSADQLNQHYTRLLYGVFPNETIDEEVILELGYLLLRRNEDSEQEVYRPGFNNSDEFLVRQQVYSLR